MLRKISHIILSVLLLVTTMGLTIDKHYCGSRLVSVSIVNDTDTCCDQDDGCCKDVTDTYKLSADYTFSQANINFNLVPTILPVLSFFYISSLAIEPSDIEFSWFVPPRELKTTLSDFQTYLL